MILRRLADAIRQQNWFTVVLEIAIVVIGIFIGLQVDDWNQSRQDRKDERLYLERLHDEMLGAERLSARILRRRIENQGKLGAVLDIVFDQPERETLTEDECMTVTTLHFFNVVVTGLSAAQELTASGRMDILRDAELRAALGVVRQAQEATGTYISIQPIIAHDLAHLYPELVTTRAYYDTGREEIYARVSCDLPGMRDNPQFLNDFSNNTDIYDAYVRDGLLPWARQMRHVHDLLDKNLDIRHGEATP